MSVDHNLRIKQELLQISEIEQQVLEEFNKVLGAPIALFHDRYDYHFSDFYRYFIENPSRIYIDLKNSIRLDPRDVFPHPSKTFSGVGLINTGHIRTIICHGMNLSALPAIIGNLTYLARLNLRNNALKTLPKEFGKLSRLQYLDLQDNAFTTLPEAINQLTKLQEISLKKNAFTLFPENLTLNPSLLHIDFSGNRLQTIPPSIHRLANLQAIIFDSNEICSLPNPFGPFPQLESLQIANNQLEFFPEWIGPYIIRQVYINFSNNRIHTIPTFIRDIPLLNTFNLENNPLDPPYNFIIDRASRIKEVFRHPHHIIPQPPRIYFIRNMVKLWEEFPANLIALLTANRLPGNWFHQMILHSNAGGFVLQKCAEIGTLAANQYAAKLSEEYRRIPFGEYDLYGPV